MCRHISAQHLAAGTTIRKAAGPAGWTTPIKVAQAVVQAVEYEPCQCLGWGRCASGARVGIHDASSAT